MGREKVALLWSMYFCSIASIERHPGKFREGERRLSLKECGDYADIMLDKLIERFPEFGEKEG